MERSRTPSGAISEGLERFQQALLRVPGISRASVVGADTAREIHIVTDSDRAPKQIVRDVQSLAAANFGMQIDHRIVSVVRLQDPSRSGTGRPYIEKIGLGARENLQWVETTMRWPDGATTLGSGAAGVSRQTRARGAAVAVVECLDRALRPKALNAEVDHVEIYRIGSSEWILVHVSLYEDGVPLPLLGAALVHDDAATAGAKAALDAINRRLFG